MPFTIDSKTFADEFNSGTTTEFISANVGDEITATIDITFQELFDANDSADYSITAGDYSTYPFSGKQSFLLSNLDFSTFQNSFPNFFSNGIEITTDVGGGGTFTVDSIITEFNNLRIVCNEATSITASADASGKIWISETITDCNLDYCVGGSNNNNDLSPALEIDDNLPPNFATTTSPLDATDTVTVNTIPFTYEGAYKTGSLTIRGTGTTTYSQSFQLIHTFELTPISLQYSEGEYQPDDINKPSNVDLSDLFNNLQSKYVLNGVFKNQVVGGVSLPFNFNENNLTVKVFDKNYSTGGNTNYSYSNFSIVRTSDSEVSDVPLIQAKFTVSFDVDNTTDSPFSTTNTKVKVGIENIAQTIDNTEDYEQTFLYDNAITTLDAVATTGTASGDAASITNYTAVTNSASSITVSFDVEFTANAITQINDGNGRNYFSIFVETQNHTLDYTNSDRVVLQVFKGAGIQDILVDPIEVVETKFITAPYDDFGTGIDADEIDGFPTQLIVGSTRFFANWSGRDNLRINTVTQNLVLKNSSTLEEISLEDEVINVNAFPLVSSQYPDINFDIEKGYKIPSSEVRNRVRMFNDGDGGDAHFFQAIFPFFIRWEYYTDLILNNVPSSILDNAEPNKGKNYFIHRIEDLANWTLNYRINFKCSESGVSFSQDFDYPISTSQYESHPDITSRVIRSFKEDGVTPLESGGIKYIDSDENTLISYESTLSTAPSDISEFEIEIYIEAFENGSPTKIQRISSVNNLLGSSWFTDTGAGDGLVAKSIDGNKAIGKVLIDSSKLSIYDNYRVYGNIYTPPRPTDYFISESGDYLITETSDNYIRE